MRIKLAIQLSGILMLCTALAACNGAGSKTAKENSNADTNSAKTKSEVKNLLLDKNYAQIDENLTAFAYFIAGLEYKKSYTANTSDAWKNYSSGNNTSWKNLCSRMKDKISSWVDSANLEIPNEPKTLFYPFAGGDFFYPDLFFPKQDTIYMIGLEPCGSIFHPDSVGNSKLGFYYGNLQKSLFFPHKYGFFRTLSMEVDFNTTLQNGTMHTILFYMAKFGYQIHYLHHFNVDNNGNEIDITEATQVKKPRKYKSIKIGYSKPGDKHVRQLIYSGIDASNGALRKENAGYVKYIKKRKNIVGFYKAASYLMHYDDENHFTIIREYMLGNASRVLQDDSGIPYKHFLKSGFDVTLLGRYTRTISLFHLRFQPDMKKAYAEKLPTKLPFTIGYNAEFGECNLQHAVKKK